jgi:hypothetical protein
MTTAARTGLTRQQALAAFGIDAEGLRLNLNGCQKRADDFYRGWESWTPGDGKLTDRAEAAYRGMVTAHADLGRVNREAFVAGFVAAGLS